MIEYQAWICPKCCDAHLITAECSPIINKPFSPHPDDNSYIAQEFRKLEAKLKWQEAMLDRAKKYLKLSSDTHDIRNSDFDTAIKWLSDLEQGAPK